MLLVHHLHHHLHLPGVSEEFIAENHNQRELEEEAIMLGEVMTTGGLLDAEGRKELQAAVKITKTNFNAKGLFFVTF